MSNQTTAAQDEFNSFLAKNSSGPSDRIHPEDRPAERREASARAADDQDEEDQYRASQIDAAMRMPTFGHSGNAGVEINLPPASFDSGRATGVKGVIADARSYETAKKMTWMSRVRQARRSVFGLDANATHNNNGSDSEQSMDEKDEESFLQHWRESRRRELESESGSAANRTRRTSPSVRMYGRLDEVDAIGYLDAIEKVSRDTVVVVFVYDEKCQVSATIEAAMQPMVANYPTVHFVKVHYEDIEFDNAAVPAILGYRNQGDLFANLTGIIEMIPDDEEFGTEPLRKLFQRNNIL